MVWTLSHKAFPAAVLGDSFFKHLILVPSAAALAALPGIDEILLGLGLFDVERVSMASMHYVGCLVDGVGFICEDFL